MGITAGRAGKPHKDRGQPGRFNENGVRAFTSVVSFVIAAERNQSGENADHS